jgi:hypothetical protein
MLSSGASRAFKKLEKFSMGNLGRSEEVATDVREHDEFGSENAIRVRFGLFCRPIGA